MDVLPAPRKPLSKVTGGTDSSVAVAAALRRVLRVSLVAAGRSARLRSQEQGHVSALIRTTDGFVCPRSFGHVACSYGELPRKARCRIDGVRGSVAFNASACSL